MKKISIIIPCYNLGKHVLPMLESLKIVDLSKTEIIIIDDKSTDNTLSLIKSFENFNKKWVLVENKTNQGISETRNIGISNAKGNYIYFLDGDDTLQPGFSDLEAWDLKDDFYRLKSKKVKAHKTKENYLESVQVSSMIFKREIFKSKELFFPKGIIFEDNHFIMLLTNVLLKRGVKEYFSLPVYPFEYTQYREGSITATKHEFDTVKSSFEVMKKMDCDSKVKSFFLYQLWNSFFNNSKPKTNGYIRDEDKNEVRKYLSNEYKSMSFHFWDLPILWKIRLIAYKLFKILF